MSLVLVVDDDADNRETLREVLADEGFTVQTAADGASALALIAGGLRPNVMLLDLMMPGMNGEELIARLRAGAAPDLPVVVLSALGDWEPPAGVVMLRKPADLGAVVEALRAHGG